MTVEQQINASPAAETRFFYPNRMGRVLLQSTEDVVGRGALLALLQTIGLGRYTSSLPASNLDKKFPFEEVSNLMHAIDRFYGPRGGRSITLRIGRVAFRYGLYEFGQVLGIADLTVRLLPWSIKLNQGAQSLAGLFNQFSDQIVRLEDTEETLYWHIDRCPLCWERHLTEPRCFVATGLLQESLLWLSGGKTFQVEQISCHAAGDPRCTFAIGKKPTE
jgi:predicted hydrocarbon binding protein